MFLDVYTFKHLQQPKCWSQKCKLALIRGGCIETWTREKKRGMGWKKKLSRLAIKVCSALQSSNWIRCETIDSNLWATYRRLYFLLQFWSASGGSWLYLFFPRLSYEHRQRSHQLKSKYCSLCELISKCYRFPFCLIFEASFSILVFLFICLLVWKTRSPWKGRRRTLKIMNLTKFSARTRNLRQLNSPLVWNEEKIFPMYSYPSHNEENGRINNKG